MDFVNPVAYSQKHNNNLFIFWHMQLLAPIIECLGNRNCAKLLEINKCSCLFKSFTSILFMSTEWTHLKIDFKFNIGFYIQWTVLN